MSKNLGPGADLENAMEEALAAVERRTGESEKTTAEVEPEIEVETEKPADAEAAKPEAACTTAETAALKEQHLFPFIGHFPCHS